MIRFALITGVLATFAFGLVWLALADLVVDNGGAPTSLDTSVLSWMLGHRDPVLTTVLIVITNAGGTLAMTAVSIAAGAWLLWRRRWTDTWLVATAGIGAAVLVPLTKSLVGRVRPPAADQLVVQTNQAFPSGHALGSLTVIGAVTAVGLTRLTSHRARAVLTCAAAVFVLAIGVSRLYLGVHWTTDVLGGWLLGAAWLTVCLTLRSACAGVGSSS